MDYTAIYNSKRVTADAAAELIRSGDWVDYAAFLCAPKAIDAALAKRVDQLTDVKIRSLAYPGTPAVASIDETTRTSRFSYNSWHFSGGERKLHDKGKCHFIPFIYHEGPSHYRNNIDVDVCILRTGAMDKFGFLNYGAANSCTRSAIEKARLVIVEINENIPRCLGGFHESIHISEVDYIVESDNAPIFVLPNPVINETDRIIAEQIVSEIRDGACIQLGIGGMPNTVGKLIAASDLKNLGVHTEMLADAYLDMYMAGKISNLNKATDPGKIAYTFAFGSKALYDFIDNNPCCASYPVDYTNNLQRISSNPGVISINNALEVDLYGQVSSESVGKRHITGTGGQFDFAYGAYHSQGGKSFICLNSTATDKTGKLVSRIRPLFDSGTIVTLPRTITQYIVTEYGMVNLKGKTTWERAEALISIAHPAFRAELIKEAEAMGIWTKEKKREAVYPGKLGVFTKSNQADAVVYQSKEKVPLLNS